MWLIRAGGGPGVGVDDGLLGIAVWCEGLGAGPVSWHAVKQTSTSMLQALRFNLLIEPMASFLACLRMPHLNMIMRP